MPRPGVVENEPPSDGADRHRSKEVQCVRQKQTISQRQLRPLDLDEDVGENETNDSDHTGCGGSVTESVRVGLTYRVPLVDIYDDASGSDDLIL